MIAASDDRRLRVLLRRAEARLQDSDSAGFDAQLLLCHVLGKPRSWLYTGADPVLDTEQLAAFETLLARREAGEPVAYLLGERAFWTFRLQVNAAVLIPRPETELLVESALASETGGEARVADLGTGSGAIALALAVERPGWQVHATDNSEAALALARANGQRIAPERVSWHLGDWCDALPATTFDLLVSNPPYIAENDPHLGRGDLRFEPRGALAAGPDGMRDIARIIDGARGRLAPDGLLLIEHGFDQGEAVRAVFARAGYADITTRQDYAGHERVTTGRQA